MPEPQFPEDFTRVPIDPADVERVVDAYVAYPVRDLPRWAPPFSRTESPPELVFRLATEARDGSHARAFPLAPEVARQLGESLIDAADRAERE